MKTLLFTMLLGVATITNAQTNKDNLNVQQSKETVRVSPSQEPEFTNAEELAKGLSISQDEAEKVWTKYTEYKSARKTLMEKKRESMKGFKSSGEKMSDKDYEMAYRTGLETQRERINLDESYYDLFLKILPASKVHMLLMNDRNNKKHFRNNERKQEQTQNRMKQAE